MTEHFYDYGAKDPDLLSEMVQTERALERYANLALSESTVNVSINDCQHPFINLPDALAEALPTFPRQPRTIRSVDLELDYDRETSRFTTLYAGLHLDNNFSLIFRHVNPKKFRDSSEKLFYGALLFPDGKMERQTTESQLVPESQLAEILTAVGIGLASGPQEASWSEIKAILQFAGNWSAKTSHQTLLNALHSVLVTDSVEGSGIDSRARTLDSDDGLRSREISFCLDEAPSMTEKANFSWKAVASSKSPTETPCINGLWRVPLRYEKPTMSDDFDREIIIEGPAIRHEVAQAAMILPLDKRYLVAARSAIEMAIKP